MGRLESFGHSHLATQHGPVATLGIIQDVDLTKCAVSQAQGGPAPGVAVMAALHDLAATRGWGGLVLDPLAARWLQQQVQFLWYLQTLTVDCIMPHKRTTATLIHKEN